MLINNLKHCNAGPRLRGLGDFIPHFLLDKEIDGKKVRKNNCWGNITYCFKGIYI